jgi:dUTP pyrophosphatase
MIPLVKVKKLDKDAQVPAYAKTGDAGADLRAVQNAIIPPKTTVLIKTGIAVEVPVGYEAQIRSRSGLAARNSVFVLNSPGTVDSGYRGEVCVILRNEGDLDFEIHTGDRIAQMVIKSVEQAVFDVVDSLSTSDRGEGGFGSSGVK